MYGTEDSIGSKVNLNSVKKVRVPESTIFATKILAYEK